MVENGKDTQKEDTGYCGEAFCMDMMRKMTEAKKSGLGFDCAQMMSPMKQMCCGHGEEKEEAKPNPVPPS